MKLSQLDPKDIEFGSMGKSALKLSEIHPDDIEHVDSDQNLGSKARQLFESTVVDQLPALGTAAGGLIGGLGGGAALGVGAVPGALGGAGVGGYLGKAAENAYNAAMRPDRAPKEMSEVISSPLTAGATGVAQEGLGIGAGKVVGAGAEGLGKVGSFIKNKLGLGAMADSAANQVGKMAEGLAVKATGATEKEARDFAPDAGRQLLNRKIVKFGSSPRNIANSAEAANDAAEAAKSDIVNNQLKNTKVDRNTVYNYIRNKIKELSGDESQLGLVKQLESKLEDITGVAEHSGTEIPLAQSEKVRKGFDKAGKWQSNSDATALEANKIAANAYREAGENAATSANPATGAAFKEAKDTQHLLIPIENSAARRAGVLDQSPVGGLHDIAAAGVAGIPGVIAKRTLFPRAASAGAVSVDQVAKAIRFAPDALGKFSGALQSAAARGPEALQTAVSVLSKKPEFLQLLDDLKMGVGNPAIAQQPKNNYRRPSDENAP